MTSIVQTAKSKTVWPFTEKLLTCFRPVVVKAQLVLEPLGGPLKQRVLGSILGVSNSVGLGIQPGNLHFLQVLGGANAAVLGTTFRELLLSTANLSPQDTRA